jgi:Fe2+ transport system protein FeoA
MSLDKVRKGDSVKIVNIPNRSAKEQFIRFGISEGSTVICQSKIPFGPIILKKNRQEIAVGRDLARTIIVERRVPIGKDCRRSK